jgi:hypothetical protein
MLHKKRGGGRSKWLISMYLRSIKECKWIFVRKILCMITKKNQRYLQYYVRMVHIQIFPLNICLVRVNDDGNDDDCRSQTWMNGRSNEEVTAKKRNNSEGIQSFLFSSTLTSVIMSNKWNEMTTTCQVDISIYLEHWWVITEKYKVRTANNDEHSDLRLHYMQAIISTINNNLLTCIYKKR